MQQGRDEQGRGRPRRADHFIRARLQGGRFFREGHLSEVRREVQQKVGLFGPMPEGRFSERRDGAVSTPGYGESESEAGHGRGRATEPSDGKSGGFISYCGRPFSLRDAYLSTTR